MKTAFCRNPDDDDLGPWCFKNGTENEVGYCDVGSSKCRSITSSCKKSQLGMDFRGSVSQTVSGKTCSAWKHRMTTYDASIAFAKNFCRNPDGDPRGPWCYIDEAGTRESCGIEWCPGYRIKEKAYPEVMTIDGGIIAKFKKPT